MKSNVYSSFFTLRPLLSFFSFIHLFHFCLHWFLFFLFQLFPRAMSKMRHPATFAALQHATIVHLLSVDLHAPGLAGCRLYLYKCSVGVTRCASTEDADSPSCADISLVVILLALSVILWTRGASICTHRHIHVHRRTRPMTQAHACIHKCTHAYIYMHL